MLVVLGLSVSGQSPGVAAAGAPGAGSHFGDFVYTPAANPAVPPKKNRTVPVPPVNLFAQNPHYVNRDVNPVPTKVNHSVPAPPVNLVAQKPQPVNLMAPNLHDRGPPGTHNTLASYMESKAAIELHGQSCETCMPAENAILNCCSPGASWDGQCEDGMNHSWLAGYAACNGGSGNVSISAASVIREERIANNQTRDELDPEYQRILQEHANKTRLEKLAKRHKLQAKIAQKKAAARSNPRSRSRFSRHESNGRAGRSRGFDRARAPEETSSGCSQMNNNPLYNKFTLKDVNLQQCEKACLDADCACYEYHDHILVCQLSLSKVVARTGPTSRAARADLHERGGRRGGDRKGSSQRGMLPPNGRDGPPSRHDRAKLGSIKSRVHKWHDDFGTPGRPRRDRSRGRDDSRGGEDVGIFRDPVMQQMEMQQMQMQMQQMQRSRSE